MAKLLWFHFYPSDWLTDEKLLACSLAAQGLWMRLLCVMHKNDKRGRLEIAGKKPTPQQLGRLVGISPSEIETLLNELVEAGVPSVTDGGVLISRRMVRDEKLRKVRSAAGKRGGDVTGNLLKQNAKQTSSKPEANGQANVKPILKQTSVSVSVSHPCVSKDGCAAESPLPLELNTERFRAAWAKWEKHRREIKKPLKPTQAETMLATMAEWGEERAVAAILFTIGKGWQGIREPDAPPPGTNGAGPSKFDQAWEQAKREKESRDANR